MEEPEESDILIAGKIYHLWQDGKYQGECECYDDENLGLCFLTMCVDEKHGLNYEVWLPDKVKLKQ